MPGFIDTKISASSPDTWVRCRYLLHHWLGGTEICIPFIIGLCGTRISTPSISGRWNKNLYPLYLRRLEQESVPPLSPAGETEGLTLKLWFLRPQLPALLIKQVHMYLLHQRLGGTWNGTPSFTGGWDRHWHLYITGWVGQGSGPAPSLFSIYFDTCYRYSYCHRVQTRLSL